MDKNLVIIDADSLVYYVGYDLSNLRLEPLGIIKLDDFIKSILIGAKAKNYLGYFAGGCGKNFRYDVAVTKPYKGTRPEKEDWYNFWEPILKKRMEEYWGFIPVCNIEADDACSIAFHKYKDKYDKVIISSPDKDLLQIPNAWFYNYSKGTTVFCNKEVALNNLCTQLIMGDSTDNIAGCSGAGKSAAEAFIIDYLGNPNNDPDKLVEGVKEFYINWYTEVLKLKKLKKLEKEFLAEYKKKNDIKRLTAKLKSDALAEFKPDLSDILTKKEAEKVFKEMYTLIKLLETPKEGKKYKFKVTKPIKDTRVDWDNVVQYEDELEQLEELSDETVDDLLDIL